MRHLGSFFLAAIFAPAIFLLTGTGLSAFNRTIAGLDRGQEADPISVLAALAALLLASMLYGILVMVRISPVGPGLAGIGILGASIWALVDIASYKDTVSMFPIHWAGAVGEQGLGILLAVPLLATLASARRWRSRPEPITPQLAYPMHPQQQQYHRGPSTPDPTRQMSMPMTWGAQQSQSLPDIPPPSLGYPAGMPANFKPAGPPPTIAAPISAVAAAPTQPVPPPPARPARPVSPTVPVPPMEAPTQPNVTAPPTPAAVTVPVPPQAAITVPVPPQSAQTMPVPPQSAATVPVPPQSAATVPVLPATVSPPASAAPPSAPPAQPSAPPAPPMSQPTPAAPASRPAPPPAAPVSPPAPRVSPPTFAPPAPAAPSTTPAAPASPPATPPAVSPPTFTPATPSTPPATPPTFAPPAPAAPSTPPATPPSPPTFSAPAAPSAPSAAPATPSAAAPATPPTFRPPAAPSTPPAAPVSPPAPPARPIVARPVPADEQETVTFTPPKSKQDPDKTQQV